MLSKYGKEASFSFCQKATNIAKIVLILKNSEKIKKMRSKKMKASHLLFQKCKRNMRKFQLRLDQNERMHEKSKICNL